LTVDTSGNGHVAALLPRGGFYKLPASLAVLALLALSGIRVKHWKARKFLWMGVCVCALAVALFLVGCGGGVNPPAPPPAPLVVTPSGTYTITVTATSSNSALAPVTKTFTLVVQ